MLNKISTVGRFIPRVRNARSMGGVPAHFKPIRQVVIEQKSHMDFLPVPQGSWQESYNKINAQNNALLLGSAIACAVTFGILYSTGCIYLHNSPPAYLKKGSLFKEKTE